MPGEFILILLLIVVIGILPVVNLIILLSCNSKISDLSFRIRQMEKALKDGASAKPPEPGPEIKIKTPGSKEPKTVPGFLLSNPEEPVSPQKPPEIRPEVKPEIKSEIKPEVKPEVRPVPFRTVAPEQTASPVVPEPSRPEKEQRPAPQPQPNPVQPNPVQSDRKPMMPDRKPDVAPDRKSPLNEPEKNSPEPGRSAIEERTAEVLSKLWQWIIVGEEYRKGGVSKEYAVATTWMLRAAMLLLLFGLAYFIKYTHDRNLFPPELRLSVAALFTLALLGVGCRLLKGAKYRIFGTALAGAGFAGLYLCVFASVSVYHLLDAWVGLAGLVVSTAAGVALALRFDSIILAVLAVCGGYLAPILMDTGSRNLAGLYGYMLILVAGSLIISRMRSWQPVNILSFIFTWSIYAASNPFPRGGGFNVPLTASPNWLELASDVNRGYAIALTFGALFFLAFCVQTVAFNLFTKRKVSLLELEFAALNGIVFMSMTLHPTIFLYGREYAAAITFGGALVYLLQIALLIRVKLEDRNLLLTLLVFACGLISLTFPLLLNQDHLSVAWSAQAAAMLYIACRTRSQILLRLSYIVYMVAAVRLLGFDLTRDYWRHSVTFLTRLLNFGSYTAALAGGFFLLKRYGADLMPAPVRPADDGSRPVYSRSSKTMFWCAFAVSFILIAGEFTYLQHLRVGGVVATAAVYLLILSLIPRLFRENSGAIRTASWLLLFVFLWYVVVSWQSGGQSVHDSLWRFFPNLLAVAALAFAGLFFGRADAGNNGKTDDSPVHQMSNKTGTFFLLSAIVLWFVYSTDETGFLVRLYGSPSGARIAVSLLWGAYALALLAFGILRKKKIVRIPALVLFAVTVLKIFFFDLVGTPALYRIAGCMITGVVLVAGAWLYARFAQKGDASDETRP
ncbi:MAG: DUF2339 domain-containing protein [Lentisphaeria bacterium]|nr:DUF2339 domain-containing protein [Lentisphaeria bacterium]